MEGGINRKVDIAFYGQTLNVGRVMTPTLSLAVEREARREKLNNDKAKFEERCLVVVPSHKEGGGSQSGRHYRKWPKSFVRN